MTERAFHLYSLMPRGLGGYLAPSPTPGDHDIHDVGAAQSVLHIAEGVRAESGASERPRLSEGRVRRGSFSSHSNVLRCFQRSLLTLHALLACEMEEDPVVSFSQAEENEERNAAATEKLAVGIPIYLSSMSPTQGKMRQEESVLSLRQSWGTMLLSRRMSLLSYESTKKIDANQQDRYSSSFGPTPSASSLGSTPNLGSLPYNTVGDGVREVHGNSSKAEYEGESSLFAHAVFASRFLQNAVDNATNAEVAHEMGNILDSLRAAVQSGKQHSDTLGSLYPHATAMPPGSTTRNLPLPPTDKVFMCLRMAKECPQVATLWLGDFIRPAQFNDYFIKVASPGPAIEADLIIVHCGLFWLFCECSKAVLDEETKQDYNAQAFHCEANLQAVLANLRFHQPTNMDFAYAMGMAALYCLQKSKPSAAWNFINSASHIIQALGLQHNLPAGIEGAEEKAQKKNLFWTIYMTEKMLSLRLGRSSSFRDQDITLTRSGMQRPGSTFLAELAPGWINMASIQGRIYEEIYSPGALMQQPYIRTSRAQALAAELKTVMQHAQDIHDHYTVNKGQVLGLDYHEIARLSDRVIGLSMLTLIYRSIAPEKPSTSGFCHECIDTARETLREHDRCVAVITKAQGNTVFLEAYINWTIIQSPFIPFIILFCHIIETCEASDLEHMIGLVQTLESTSSSSAYRTCSRQRDLFRALYDVAAKYVEVKSCAHGAQAGMSWSMESLGFGEMDSAGIVGHSGTTNTADAPPSHSPSQVEVNRDVDGLVGPWALQNLVGGDGDLEMDLSGVQLWDWFNKNQSIMRMLEDT
ncbi:fungal specific transcription factor domain-containing protein [Aspergillus affinis]|uniref:fungal specific transcription factor domain-containing protein n=1 Tax=Aspergillus affinis TaxID=1070780 RepID=UPI0022FE5D13|nr:uncharacterized protein KD926_004218 [Aspergillus affinis]KAI9035274.1 hypothetical protein KD926_004218 [Aspergillus affinis]